jgi:Ran GTPase-activating protein (RanGAP) involved in mRNA processing and transport
MPAWGASSTFRSCDSLIQRIEQNDPTLKDLVILPTKQFGADEVHRLCAVLDSNSNTHWTSLSASGHVVSVTLLQQFGQSIAANISTPLGSLSIGDRSMGDEGVSALCRALGRQHRLRAIDLSYKNMTTSGFQSVLETLGVSPTLQSLNVSRNPLLGLDATKITTSSLFDKVEELDLSDCGITHSFASDLFAKLAPSRVKRTLVLSNNPLGPGGLRSLEPLMGNICTLNLSNTSIGNEGMEVLSSFGSSAIVSLDLSRNNISFEGIPSLIACLQEENEQLGTLRNLQKLDLSSNPLSEEGVCLLANQGLAKCSNNSLQFLDLSETHCGIQGACTVLTQSKVVSLRLFNNQLGSEGFLAISELIQDSAVAPQLENLDLAGNNADINAVVSLLKAILKRESEGPSRLRSLVIGGNASGTEIEEIVAQIRQIRPDMDIARDKCDKKQ